MKKIMSGNEAMARGAFEAGVKVAAAHPGTPSTEILESIAKEYKEIYAEWSPNEEVALEVSSEASLAGARTIACMKHDSVKRFTPLSSSKAKWISSSPLSDWKDSAGLTI
jgi:indolepyruvate ferredoxin oxidoreductase alpha subunit